MTPVRRRGAHDLTAEVYHQVEQDFGVLAPPIALHARSPRVMAAAWVMLRETLVVQERLARVAKEAIAAEVSRANTCPYCATIHQSVTGRLRPDGAEPVTVGPDPESLAMVMVMHYLNRMVNVFLRDVPLPPGTPRWALRPVMRVLGTDMLNAARESRPAGRSLALLPVAGPAGDLPWLTGHDRLADAFARAGAAIEAAGRRSMPAAVREVVRAEVARWDGAPKGISRAWAEPLLTGLSPEEKPVARLALLVTFASFQVDGGIVQRCRESGSDDAALTEICAWSALAAARKEVFLVAARLSIK